MHAVALVLWVLAGALALALVGGLAALCMPLRVSVAVRGLDLNEGAGLLPEGQWRWEVRWLLGLLRWSGAKEPGEPPTSQLHVLGFTIPVPAKFGAKGGAARRRVPFGQVPRGPRPRVNLSDLRVLWPEVRRLLASLRRCGEMEAAGDLVYGFEDPALTGWCEAARAMVPWPRGLALTPDFGGPRLSGDASVRLTVTPIRGAVAFTRFLLRPPVRRWWWRQLRQRRRREAAKNSPPAASALRA